MVLSLMKVAILTRFLDKSDFGLMAIAMIFVALLNLILDLGFSIGILHFQNISIKSYSSIYWLNICFSLILYLFLILTGPFVAQFYQDPILDEILPLIGLHLLFTALGRQLRVREQKALHFQAISLIEVFGGLLSFIGAVVLGAKGFGVWALVWSELIRVLAINCSFFIRGLIKRSLRLQFSWLLVQPFLKMGVFSLGGQLVNQISKELDVLIIGRLFEPSVLGAYTLAKQLVNKPAQVLYPIVSNVISPMLAVFQKNRPLLREKFLELSKMLSSTLSIIYLALVLFVSPIIKLLYGPDYLEITNLVRILSLYMYLRTIIRPVGMLIIATGRTDISLFWNIGILPLFGFVLWWFAPMGLEAIGLGLCAMTAGLVVLTWYFIVGPLTGSELREYMNGLIPTPMMIPFRSIYKLSSNE